MTQQGRGAATAIAEGQTSLGVELGSTNIKACLIGPDHQVLATGNHVWENQFVDRLWTYSEAAIWSGLQAAVASLMANVETRHGVALTRIGALGFSAMMHGYLAFDANGRLLVPFRTWRNTNTERAAAELTKALRFNLPLRWSASHLYQAVIDEEPHVVDVDYITTLSGYVHWRLTGRKVLGVGDASGMFPIDPATHDFDAPMLKRFGEMVAARRPGLDAAALFPKVLVAGEDAGTLTAEGAALLDPTGRLQPGVPVCPPEGDAGTGMVATNAVAQRTGNISAGTSIFAMVVLEKPLTAVHEELDIVTTPAGDLVAMVHCNNGASELGTWAGVFTEFAKAIGAKADANAVFGALFGAALEGEADGGGLLAYNYLAGEPITGLDRGASAGRAHAREPPDARQLHAHPALRRLRHVEPGHERAARRRREAQFDVRAWRHVSDRGGCAASAGGGHRRAGDGGRHGERRRRLGHCGARRIPAHWREREPRRLPRDPCVRERQAGPGEAGPRRCGRLRQVARAVQGRTGDREGGDRGDQLAAPQCRTVAASLATCYRP